MVDDEEIILARAVATKGRSRAWIDGRMAPVSALAEAGARLVDLHGQHAHQSLLDPAMQRRSLDLFCAIDLAPLTDARAALRGLVTELDALGGDERARAREIDLLRHQLSEIDGAGLVRPRRRRASLAAEEERLAEADAHRQAAGHRPGRPRQRRRRPVTRRRPAAPAPSTSSAPPMAPWPDGPRWPLWPQRLSALQAETADLATELRQVVDTWEADPERLAEIRTRRHLIHELSRKYGEGIAGIRAYGEEIRARVSELESVEERAAALQAEIEAAEWRLAAVGSRGGPGPPSAGRPTWPGPSRNGCRPWPWPGPGWR